MNQYTLFRKWVKNSLDFHLIYKDYEGFFIVTNGYTAFKINKSNKTYSDILKKETFQNLKNNFYIYNRRLSEFNDLKLSEYFKSNGKFNTEITKIIYDYDPKIKARLLKNSNNSLVFINEKNLNFLYNIEQYKIYSDLPLNPVIFISSEIQFLIFPLRIMDFPYTINKKGV
ncbi:hypothetical protein [Clostridium brassicae]|uniref:Uncharacterized protein n=1 Tax=Clostridium brassicae TaxID=2999072 RepID=A0ABT4D6G9_9CLOT|nr:hypothetical protein [Clostridium brassicae]MCY6957894.1 hypothetical protein [Clostridium brassicae]